MMVRILDTTLREGEQTPGVYFDCHAKLAVAELLDRLGIEIIEAGHPAIGTEIATATELIANSGLRAVVGAHSRTLRTDVDTAVACGAGLIGVFYCVSDERIEGVHNGSFSDAIDTIADVISYARSSAPGSEIRYTPEDTVRTRFENVVEASATAIDSGADIISIADTTGCMAPVTDRSMFEFTSRLKRRFREAGLEPALAVHCHNDRGLALANALDGVRAGAEIVDASVMGLGERAGIVDLAQLLFALDGGGGMARDLGLLPEIYRMVSSYSNVPIPENQPLIGANAFTHCAGIHTHASLRDPMHYQSIDPSVLGRRTEICLDHMSGISSVRHSLGLLGRSPDAELEKRILDEVRVVGRRGRRVDLTELGHIAEKCSLSMEAGNHRSRGELRQRQGGLVH